MLEDNGQGFDPNKITPGLGLESVTARLQKLGGTLTIDSGLGNGTTLVVEVPLAPDPEESQPQPELAKSIAQVRAS